MAIEQETLPNYSKCPDSPQTPDLGLKIRLMISGAHPINAPLVIRGAYSINQSIRDWSRGLPLTRTMLIVYRRDDIAVWTDPVQEAHNLLQDPPTSTGPTDPLFRESGYFNIDLRKVVTDVLTPGKYWVMACLGDHVSDRIEFEIVGR